MSAINEQRILDFQHEETSLDDPIIGTILFIFNLFIFSINKNVSLSHLACHMYRQNILDLFDAPQSLYDDLLQNILIIFLRAKR